MVIGKKRRGYCGGPVCPPGEAESTPRSGGPRSDQGRGLGEQEPKNSRMMVPD